MRIVKYIIVTAVIAMSTFGCASHYKNPPPCAGTAGSPCGEMRDINEFTV